MSWKRIVDELPSAEADRVLVWKPGMKRVEFADTDVLLSAMQRLHIWPQAADYWWHLLPELPQKALFPLDPRIEAILFEPVTKEFK